MKVKIDETKNAPNLSTIISLFNVDVNYVIIAYGDTIYAPNKTMSRDLLVHELVHCERQGFNTKQAERWWQRYLEDKEFRLNEEVLAYKAQFNFCKNVYKDKNRQIKILYALAKELSSPMYGEIVSLSEAIKLIES